ncbi:TPR-like protein [Laetiporus sulphureus 93-53]
MTISALNDSVRLTSEVHPLHQHRLGMLAQALSDRADRTRTRRDLDRAISIYEKIISPSDLLSRAGNLTQLGFLLLSRFELCGDAADLQQAIDAGEKAVASIPDAHDDKPGYLSNYGHILLRRFELLGEQSDIEKTINTHRAAIRLTKDDSEELPGRLQHLGNAYTRRFLRFGDTVDIDAAVTAYENAIQLTPDDQNKATYLGSLGMALKYRFDQSGELNEIRRAISVLEAAVGGTGEDDRRMSQRLDNLAISLISRFKRLGESVDIDRAVEMHEKVLRSTTEDHAARYSYMNHLGVALLSRFQRFRELTDIDRAVSIIEESTRLIPDRHVDRHEYFNSLGTAFLGRFERTSKMPDIDSAITAFKMALQMAPKGHTGRSKCLSNLGTSCLRRFEYLGNISDVEEAIFAHTEALSLVPDGHSDKALFSNNLGISFLRRFDLLGNLKDIDRAIDAHQNAVNHAPDGHPDKPVHMSNLPESLLARYGYHGSLEDIDKAISLEEGSISITPADYAQKAERLVGLANALSARFKLLGETADINRAIDTHTEAIRLTPCDHADLHLWHNNLANAYMLRAKGLSDFDNAVSHHQLALQLTSPGHRDRATRLNNAGVAHYRRYQLSGDQQDLLDAITMQSEAAHSTSDDDMDKSMWLMNLGASYARRFHQSGSVGDIDQAITTLKSAVRLIPEGHARKPGCLHSLAVALMERYERLPKEPEVNDLDVAILHFREAALSTNGEPEHRFDAALGWARAVSQHKRDDVAQSLDGYATALDLMPRLAWVGQTINARHARLASFGKIANEAAAVAINANRVELALEWLEQARAIVWGQLMHLRTPMDDLRTMAPELAKDLERISKALDEAGTRSLSDGGRKKVPCTIEQATQQHHRWAEEWERLVSEARQLPGLEGFLRPKSSADILGALRCGPIVILNVHVLRCDALIVNGGSNDITLVPLSLRQHGIYRLQSALERFLTNSGIRKRDDRGAQMVSTDYKTVDSILSELWASIVQPVLQKLGYSVSDPPRLWWCPTGPLAFLPLHAAGKYTTNDPGFKTSDYVASSYTPTLAALKLEDKAPAAKGDFRGLLTISQSATLPNASVEVDKVRQLASSVNISSYALDDAEGTADAVLENLKQYSWVHLACHGVQNKSEPTKSSFILHGGSLKLSQIISQSYDSADFAFLSACQTATGAEDIPEEAAHLAAGMLAAGYRSVIATMWSILDRDAPLVAEEVYRRLLSRPDPDSSEAALALHHGIKRLRENYTKSDGKSFSWVPFIHVGI